MPESLDSSAPVLQTAPVAEAAPVVELTYLSMHSSTLLPMVRTVGVLAIVFGALEIISSSTNLVPMAVRGGSLWRSGDRFTQAWFALVAIGSALNLLQIIAGILSAQRRPLGRGAMLTWAWCELVLQAGIVCFRYFQERPFTGYSGASWQDYVPVIVELVRTWSMWATFPLLVILFYSRQEFRDAFYDYSRVG